MELANNIVTHQGSAAGRMVTLDPSVSGSGVRGNDDTGIRVEDSPAP